MLSYSWLKYTIGKTDFLCDLGVTKKIVMKQLLEKQKKSTIQVKQK